MSLKIEGRGMKIVRKHDDEITPMSEERAREIQLYNEDIDYLVTPELDEDFLKILSLG